MRSVVPNPHGIVTPIISLRDHPNLSKVLTHTSNANVESNHRNADYRTWQQLYQTLSQNRKLVWRIFLATLVQLNSLRHKKDEGQKQRVRFSSLLFTSVKHVPPLPVRNAPDKAESCINSTFRANVPHLFRMIITCPSKRLLRAIRLPFSKIRKGQIPANTTSSSRLTGAHERKGNITGNATSRLLKADQRTQIVVFTNPFIIRRQIKQEFPHLAMPVKNAGAE